MMTSLFRWLECLLSDVEAAPQDRSFSQAIPDVAVTDQFGRQWQFRRDFLDVCESLIINTMYTTCRDSCPGTSAQIEELRQELSPTFEKRITFLSITLEPHVDGPDKLFKYAKIYGAGEAESDLCPWLFLHVAPQELDVLRRSLGFFELDPVADSDITQHASLLLVGHVTKNRWAKFPSELRTPVLLDSIRRLCGNSFEEQYGLADSAS